MTLPTGLAAADHGLAERVAAAGHAHCFHWWADLADPARRALLDQLATVDFDLAALLYAQATASDDHGHRRLGPADVIRLRHSDADRAADASARELGEAALAAGEVAVLLVAGGQGTRLGWEGPKGTFPITPVERKTFFQWHAEKVEAVRRRYGRPVPWYIMTSDATDAATRAYFTEQHFFGLPEEDCMFFRQGMLPALDRDGKLILDGKGHVHESPNGHGGTLLALRDSGALEDMRRRGIVDIFYFQVDNVLTVMADPRFIGHHRARGAEMSAKVVAKTKWDEKVGVLGTIDGQLGVIEYTELSEAQAKEKDAHKRFVYWAGNEAVHVLRVDFVERITGGELQLPYHIAEKSVPCLDETGQPHTPSAKNGLKFETFIFDALALAERTAILEVRRAEDFAPVKNADGEDSPASAQQMLCDLFGEWLEACGVSVPLGDHGQVNGRIEISPLTADSAAALKAALPPGTTFQDGLSL